MPMSPREIVEVMIEQANSRTTREMGKGQNRAATLYGVLEDCALIVGKYMEQYNQEDRECLDSR